MKSFPAVIIDDFFEDPDAIVEIASSLTYKPQEEGVWPGVRSNLLSNIDDKPNIFWTGKKVISNKYDYEEIKKLEDFYNLNIYIWDNFYASYYCEPRVTLDKYLPFTPS